MDGQVSDFLALRRLGWFFNIPYLLPVPFNMQTGVLLLHRKLQCWPDNMLNFEVGLPSTQAIYA